MPSARQEGKLGLQGSVDVALGGEDLHLTESFGKGAAKGKAQPGLKRSCAQRRREREKEGAREAGPAPSSPRRRVRSGSGPRLLAASRKLQGFALPGDTPQGRRGRKQTSASAPRFRPRAACGGQ